jgi:flagellar biosynthesis/type III secretory pathway ATPase
LASYRKGTDPLLDRALDRLGAIEALLHHGYESRSMADTLQRLQQIAGA